jgi:hypothetical protein
LLVHSLLTIGRDDDTTSSPSSKKDGLQDFLSEGKASATSDCDPKKDCSGHGTCKNDQAGSANKCECEAPYGGSDCSYDNCNIWKDCAACSADLSSEKYPNGCAWLEDEGSCVTVTDAVEGDTCHAVIGGLFGFSYFTIGMYVTALAFVIYVVLWIKRKVEQCIARVKAYFGGGAKVEQTKEEESAPFIANEAQADGGGEENWADDWGDEANNEPSPPPSKRKNSFDDWGDSSGGELEVASMGRQGKVPIRIGVSSARTTEQRIPSRKSSRSESMASDGSGSGLEGAYCFACCFACCLLRYFLLLCRQLHKLLRLR